MGIEAASCILGEASKGAVSICEFWSCSELRAFLYFKGITFPTKSPTHECYLLFQHYPSQFSLHFCTATSDSRSFAVSYLISNLGLSPEYASKASHSYHLRFKTSENADSVLSFFRNHGFSNSQVQNVIRKAPWLLNCDPGKRVLPKFEFLLSKGASTSDIVHLVSRNPRFLAPSLENSIVPTYELAYRFLQSDKDTVACVIRNPAFLGDSRVPLNIKVLLENGVTNSNIARLLRTWCLLFNTTGMLKVVEELKDLGFDPSKSTFGIALLAKKGVSKIRWGKKVDALKKWGWSDEAILEAFRRQPYCMLASIDKINAVMSFWVNQLGWDALVLAKRPLFGSSLEKTIIPRATVMQFLLKKGLRKKNASLIMPFMMPEKFFLSKFVECFKAESSYILKLYEEKLNLAQTRENIGCRSPNM